MGIPAARPLIMQVAMGGASVGGVTQHVLCLAPHLQRQGFEVVLVFLGAGVGPQLAASRGIQVEVVPKRRRGDARAVLDLARLFRRRRPALVHTHTLSTNFYGRMAAQMAGVPSPVITVHSFMRDLLRYDPSGGLGNRLLFWHNQLFNRRASRLIAISNGVRDWLLDSGMPAARVRVIRCGIDLDAGRDESADRQAARRAWGLDSEHWVIGNVARAHPVKGQAVLLEAAAPLVRGDPLVRLVIIGDGPERSRLLAAAESEGIADRVLLPGAVPQAARLTAGFDVFALSSHMEGIPLAVLEAMAVSRPVVATAVGGLGEAITSEVSGLLVAPGSPSALREALLRVRSDPGLASRLGAAGRQVVEEGYDARITSAQIAEVYREVLAGDIPPRGGGVDGVA